MEVLSQGTEHRRVACSARGTRGYNAFNKQTHRAVPPPAPPIVDMKRYTYFYSPMDADELLEKVNQVYVELGAQSTPPNLPVTLVPVRSR